MHSQYKQDFIRATKSNIISNILIKHIIKIFEKCDECWTLNEEIKRIFIKDYGYTKDIRIINNATDMLPSNNINESRERINKLYNLTNKEIIFLFVGRINKLKNIDLIIDSLSKLRMNNFKMIFVGTGQDENYLKNIINQKKLLDKVILCGKINDRKLLRDYYVRADLFLFPSLYDSSSLVQIEAASQKTPTLFVDKSVTSAKVTNNVDGFFAKNNSDDYARRIDEIFTNKKLYNEVCKKAYNNLYINWDDEIENIYKLYLNIIERSDK